MKRSNSIIFLVILVLAVLSCSCGRSKAETPSETVIKIYMAANEGWYSTVERYIYSEVLNRIKQNYGTLYMIDMWDVFTRYGRIQKIEIVDEIIRGERADVVFKVHFEDGQVREDRDVLIQENRLWKILFDFFNREDILEEYNRSKSKHENDNSEEK